jgi:HK97 family phage prohead protease
MQSRKQLALNNVSLKFANADTGMFGGYASTFGGVDSYNDTIMAGAYANVIDAVMSGSARMPKMFCNHKSWDVPIGKWVKMYEDDKGLYVEGELTMGNPQAAVVKAAMLHETVDGLSIGYMLKPSDVEYSEIDGQTIRIIKNISELAEVSVVTFPADDMARVDLTSVKNSLDQIESIKDFEDFLREAGGFSKSLATATASRAKRLFTRSESEKLSLPSELQQIIAANLLSSRAL